MRRYVLSALVLLLAGLAASPTYAAKPMTPKPQLEKDATHIIVGKVRSISFTKHVDPQYVTTT
jgi:hypothetical protein